VGTTDAKGWPTHLQSFHQRQPPAPDWQDQFLLFGFISYKRKRTMSLIDEFDAATQSLDRILEKMEEADPADKERLEAYVKSMQVKVQQILKAILRVH
jgi:hypothetical protein